jgi:hypothetical protein
MTSIELRSIEFCGLPACREHGYRHFRRVFEEISFLARLDADNPLINTQSLFWAWICLMRCEEVNCWGIFAYFRL